MKNGKTNAISLLRADHAKVKGLLKDLSESTESPRARELLAAHP